MLSTHHFFNKVCEKAASFQNIIIFTNATVQGEVIGSLFGFLTKHRFYFIQHGFSNKYMKFSIGNLLIYHTMEDLIKKKIDIFDFCRGMHEYKLRWTQTASQDYVMILSKASIGRTVLEWLRLKRSIKRNGRLAGIRYRLLNKD